MVTNTRDMSREEWLLERRTGIGGSDASVILGLNKYKTPFELWLEKTGQTDLEDTAGEAAYFGNVLEDLVAKEFEIRSDKKVRRRNEFLRHPEHPFIIGNIDRKVVGESALLECKTASAYLSKEWESDEVPESYIVQVQHYLGVTGYQKAYMAVLIGGQRFVWKEIDRDQELIDMIFAAEIHFWEHHVKKGIPPALDGSSAAEEFLKKRYAEVDPSKTVDLGFAYKEKIEQHKVLNETIKELKAQKILLENEMKYELKEAESGFVHNYEVKWKRITQNKVHTETLKEKFPDVYKAVLKESSYRKFEVKEIK